MQSSVNNFFQSSGVVGEFSRSENQDSFGAKLNSASEALNVVGSVVFHVDSNDDQVGVAATGNFAGVLVNPKSAVRPTLDAQAFLLNETQCEVATRGYLWVSLPAAAKTGDFIYFSDTDGKLSSSAPAVAPPAGVTRLAGGKVVGSNITEAGTAEIYFDVAGSTETP